MAFGGGTWLSQSKILPGAYFNFISTARTSVSLSERGIAAFALPLSWGPEGEVITVTADDFQTNSMEVLGYAYTAEQLKPLRELFATGLRILYLYRTNQSGVRASNTYAEARYPGVRGNDITIKITKNEAFEESTNEVYDVSTILDGTAVDTQLGVRTAEELIPNTFVTWKSEALAETAGTPLTAGTDGTAAEGAHQAFLDKMESYQFNVIGCDSSDDVVKGLYANYTKRMRDEVGAKFQCVLHSYTKADYEGVISVKNGLVGDAESTAAVYWVTGIEAAAPVNSSICATNYNGEYDIDVDLTQTELEEAIKAGELVFHRADEDIQILSDINTFTGFTVDKNEDFSENQVIRVLDQIAIDIANLFNSRYRDKVQNDASGRASLWADISAHHKELQRIRAIENFNSDMLKVLPGNLKKAVLVEDHVQPTVAMKQLYMNVYVS